VNAVPTESELDAPRRAFTRACVVGGLLGAVLFSWMLTRGTFDFLMWQRVGDFYDAQAHRLIGGHLSVNGLLLGVEAFTARGNAYMYQGPVPALLRIPIVAIAGHHLDGRLTELSMLGAFTVALVFASRLHWRARRFLRGAAPVSRTESLMVGFFTFVLGGGSILLYEASRAWVYDEALIWGAAFALASVDFIAAFVERPTFRRLIFATAFAACTILTRASVGLGPVIGLGLLTVGAAAQAWLARRREPALVPAGGVEAPTAPADAEGTGPSGPAALRWLTALAPTRSKSEHGSYTGWLAAAAVTPLALYAVVNYAKFRTLFSVPFYDQEFSMVDPGRKAFLAANHGTLFGPQFVPTTVLAYLRPDALRFTSLFPFVDFSKFPGTIIGNVQFDLFDRTSSLPSSVPFLFVLGLVGFVALFRPRAWRADAPLSRLRVAALAALAGGLTILPFGYLANRYLADFLPFLALSAAVGLQVFLVRVTSPNPQRWVRPALAILVLLGLFTTWVSFALALRYQREWSYNLDSDVIAGFIGFQKDVNNTLGGGPIAVSQGTTLPDGVGHPGKLFVLGNCEALYVSDGMLTNAVKVTPWNAVEHTNAAGHFVLRLRFPPRPVGTRVPILSTGPPGNPNILFAEYRPDHSILFEYREPSSGFVRRYLPFPLDTNKTYTVDVSADWRLKDLTVMFGDVAALDATYRYRGEDFHVGVSNGAAGVEARFPGPIRSERVTTPLCRSLLTASHHRATAGTGASDRSTKR